MLTCALLSAAVLGVWARRSFLHTDTFTERAGSLVDAPEVRDALSAHLAAELNEIIDAPGVISDSLPDEGALLALPLAGAVESFVADQVARFVDSDAFARLWRESVEAAHQAASRLLAGTSDVVEATDGEIVINLLPVVGEVLARLADRAPAVLGDRVDLPTVTVEDVPERARTAIGEALGVDLDEGFGTFTVYDDGALATAQGAVRTTNRIVWLLVVLVPVVAAATLLVAPRRRRTVLQLAAGAALAMVALRRLSIRFQSDLVDLVRVDQNRPAVAAATDAFLDPFRAGARSLLLIALAVAAVAVLSGPYPAVVRLRGRAAAATRSGADALVGRARDESTLAWVVDHRDQWRAGGAVVAAATLWLVDLTWTGLAVVVALLVAYDLALGRLAAGRPGPAGTPVTSEDPGPGPR